jgi:hypothetical protein
VNGLNSNHTTKQRWVNDLPVRIANLKKSLVCAFERKALNKMIKNQDSWHGASQVVFTID